MTQHTKGNIPNSPMEKKGMPYIYYIETQDFVDMYAETSSSSRSELHSQSKRNNANMCMFVFG